MASRTKLTSQSSWERFPATYRAEALKRLIRWIIAGESGTVAGLPGAGRATFLGFICHRLEIIQAHLEQHDCQSILIPVDLINLSEPTLSTFYRTILRSFFEFVVLNDRFEPSMQQRISDLYRRTEADQDPFLPQSALRELLLYFQTNNIRIGLIMNRFDRFCESAQGLIVHPSPRRLSSALAWPMQDDYFVEQGLVCIRAEIFAGASF